MNENFCTEISNGVGVEIKRRGLEESESIQILFVEISSMKTDQYFVDMAATKWNSIINFQAGAMHIIQTHAVTYYVLKSYFVHGVFASKHYAK